MANESGAASEAASSGVLDGLRVLDFGRFIAGPYCAALLGDLGADVIRVERPGGAEDRFIVPLAPGGEGPMYLQVNRNKRSLFIDLGTEAGRDEAAELIRGADVVVANYPERTLAAMGLDWTTVSALNPRAVLGETPQAYQLRLRLARAQDLLANTAQGIAEIAADAGYASQQGFTTAFRRAFGITPARYRRERRG